MVVSPASFNSSTYELSFTVLSTDTLPALTLGNVKLTDNPATVMYKYGQMSCSNGLNVGSVCTQTLNNSSTNLPLDNSTDDVLITASGNNDQDYITAQPIPYNQLVSGYTLPSPTPTGGGSGIPEPDGEVLGATSDTIGGLQSTFLDNLAIIIPICAGLLISVAVVFFVIRKMRKIVRN